MRNAIMALAFGMAVTASPLHAQSTLPGISFDLMPKGCRIHGVYGDGRETVDEYMGVRRGMHVTRTFDGPKGRNLVRTTTYDANGFMVRKDWANGKWETFTPYSCFDRPGTCTYTYRNADGAEKTYRGKVSRRGDRITSQGGFEGEPPFPKSVVTTGPFNNGAGFTEGNTSFRVSRYEGCGVLPGA